MLLIVISFILLLSGIYDVFKYGNKRRCLINIKRLNHVLQEINEEKNGENKKDKLELLNKKKDKLEYYFKIARVVWIHNPFMKLKY